MRKLMLLMVFVFCSLAIWGQTAADILKSKDVLAYTCKGEAFLMDINTAREVKITTAKKITQLVWDSSGTRLFGFGYDKKTDGSGKFAYLTEFLLPSLKEKVIIDEKVDNWDLVNMEIELGKDNRLYVYECIEEYDDYDDYYSEPYYDWYVYKYYDLAGNSLASMNTDELSDDRYFPSYLNKAVREGHGIKNQWVTEKETGRYELFITDDPKAATPSYRQLTKLDTEKFKMKLNGDKINFKVAPNGKLILYAYHYSLNDPSSDFSYTMLISSDGKKSMFVADDAPVQYEDEIFWTAESKLVYCGKTDTAADKLQLAVIDPEFKSKPLKTFDMKDRPKLSYRYK